MHRYFFIFLAMFSFNSFGVVYSFSEIDGVINNQRNKQLSREFTRGFFTANNPRDFIQDYLHKVKDTNKPILIEYQLYQLLTEISYQAKQDFLLEFVVQMKSYKSQAFKIHDEGRVPVAIYNINAKAKGIENIWMASGAVNYYVHAFERDPMATLLKLKNNIHSLKQPEWFGLKKSIGSISQDNRNLIIDFLLQDKENLLGLSKFVAHFTLITANQELAHFALQNLDKSNSEYILRNLKNHFDRIFVKQELIDVIEKGENAGFAISMLSEYINEREISDKLVSLLSDEKYSKQVALVLAQVEDESVIQEMESLYFESNSELEKKHIIFVLKMNQLSGADLALRRISRTLKSGSKVSEWLDGFNGGVK